jgi:hypothetical protein
MHYNGNPVRPKPLLIEPGWSIDQLTTVVECDIARDTLVSAIIKTEEALNAHRANEAAGVNVDIGWACRAKTALRLKEAALARVLEIRARLMDETPAHKLLAIVRNLDPALYSRAMNQVREQFPQFDLSI